MVNSLEELKKAEIEKANEEVERIINQGVPIASMSIFNVFDSYELNERIKNNIDYTMELYFELLENLKIFTAEDQLEFLEVLKKSDIIDNQSIEKEDSFFISLYSAFSEKFAIDELINLSDKGLSREDFVNIHDQLLYGTNSEDKIGLRNDNLKFVGFYQVNPNTEYHFDNRAISYFPIRYTEIDAAIEKFLLIYNEDKTSIDEYAALLIPILYHGIIAALQLFKDGNTRYARLIQNVEMFKLTNNKYKLDLPLPLVYATRLYAGYRKEYRKLVEKLVINNDINAWNEWIIFNLKRIQDGIMYNDNCLEKISYCKKYQY